MQELVHHEDGGRLFFHTAPEELGGDGLQPALHQARDQALPVWEGRDSVHDAGGYALAACDGNSMKAL
jgi:hypothetical protein